MSKVNSKLAQEALGLQNPLDFATAAGVAGATNKNAVQLLIDAISKEETDPTDHRLYLDEMSPACRTSLYVMLVAMKAAVFNV